MDGVCIKAEHSSPEPVLLFVSTDLDVKTEPSSPESQLHDTITLLRIKVEPGSSPTAPPHEHVDTNEELAEAALGSDDHETPKDIVDDRLGISEDAGESSRKNLQGSANVSYKCDVCGRCFTNKYAFKRHQTVHSGEKQHQCKTCGRCFARSCSLKSHQMVHTGERPHACPVCGQKFAKRLTLKQHHRALHTNEKPYVCVVCSQKFAFGSSLYKHKRVHMNEAPYAFACEICPCKFRKKESLEKHKQLHASGVLVGICTECGKSFKSMKSLWHHLKWHNMEKAHACQLCPARFTRKSVLERHLFTHKGEKPYKCCACERLYSSNRDLSRHIHHVHTDTVGATVFSTDSRVEIITPSHPFATEPEEDFDINETGPSAVAFGNNTSVMPQTSRTEISGEIKDSEAG